MSITDRITQLEREVGELQIRDRFQWRAYQDLVKATEPERDKWIETNSRLNHAQHQLEALKGLAEEMAKEEASA